MSEIPILGDLPGGRDGKRILMGLRQIVSRIALQHLGTYGLAEDLLLRIYVSGVAHGAILGKRVLEREPGPHAQ